MWKYIFYLSGIFASSFSFSNIVKQNRFRNFLVLNKISFDTFCYVEINGCLYLFGYISKRDHEQVIKLAGDLYKFVFDFLEDLNNKDFNSNEDPLIQNDYALINEDEFIKKDGEYSSEININDFSRESNFQKLRQIKGRYFYRNSLYKVKLFLINKKLFVFSSKCSEYDMEYICRIVDFIKSEYDFIEESFICLYEF